jgi:hypothetical protein
VIAFNFLLGARKGLPPFTLHRLESFPMVLFLRFTPETKNQQRRVTTKTEPSKRSGCKSKATVPLKWIAAELRSRLDLSNHVLRAEKMDNNSGLTPRGPHEAGFTTVRDVWGGDFVDVALRGAIANGSVVGPRMLIATKGVGATGGTSMMPTVFVTNYSRKQSDFTNGIVDRRDAIPRTVLYNVKRAQT